MIQSTLTEYTTQGPEADVSLDFVVCGLDMISSLSEGFETNFSLLLQSIGPDGCTAVRDLLFQCLVSVDEEVKQSGLALSGELTKTTYDLLISPPAVSHKLMQLCFDNLNFDQSGVCNNAAWTIGELVLRMGSEQVSPYASSIVASIAILMEQCAGMTFIH